MKVIDLFSGVGGLSLGAARAGLAVALAVENAPHAVAAHKLNFPSTNHIADDIMGVDSSRLTSQANIKVGDEPFGIIGGPPCQGFSTIGNRAQDDPRNQLFTRFFCLVRLLQPDFFLAENVPGIMHDSNNQLRESALALASNEYEVLKPFSISADSFGAATSRTRYFFIGYKSNRFSNLLAEHFVSTAARVTVREALKGLPRKVNEAWQTENESWRRISPMKTETPFASAMSGNIPAGVGDAEAIERLQKQNLVSGFLGTTHTPDVKRRFSRIKPGEQDSVSKAIRLKWTGLCPTLRAGTGPERGSYQAVRPIHPSENRVITPREAARLQGFPDWFQFSPTKWHSFRQIGNSVSPIVAEAVLRTILNRRKQ